MTTLTHFRLGHSTEARTHAATGRTSVPWPAVVSFAVVMAFADGFWVTSLRGAVGAIERNQTPFWSWLRESALVLPIFVLAVLGAFTLALRLFGPAPRRPRAILATAALVLAAGTLVGVALLVASSAYDYHLQEKQLVMMDSMRGMCSGDCEFLQRASFWLQVRAVGYGSGLLLVTNVVVVGWMVAVRGGRLDLSKPRPEAKPSTAGSTRSTRLDDVRAFLAAGLVGSAVVHAAVVPEHLTEWSSAGVFFVVLTAAELAVAIQVGARLQRTVLAAAAVVSAGPLLVWAYSRSFGMPFGPEAGVPESIGLADCAAVVLEVGTLFAAVILLRGNGWLRRRTAVSAHVNRLVLVAVVAIMVIGLGGTSLEWFSLTSGVTEMVHGH
jgi:hypothetical protein